MDQTSIGKSSLKGNHFRSILGFVLSAVLLWLTFKNSGLEFKNLLLDRQELMFFGASIISLIIAIWIQSIRAKLFWWNRKQKIREIKTFDSLVIGNFYNCVLPGNLGEGVRAWHFSKKNKVSFFRSFAAVFAEKWIDAQLFVLVTGILFLIRPFTKHYIFYVIFYTAFISLLLSMTYILMRKYRYIERALGMITISFKKPGKLLFQLYWHITQFIVNLEKRGLTIYYFLLCAAVFLLNMVQFFLLLKCAGIAEPVGGIYSAFLTSISMIIIVFIPAAPSNIGVIHYGLYSLLVLVATQCKVTPSAMDLQSYARFGVYVHLSFIVPEVLIGALFVAKERKFIF